jgi:hypothetical protein
MAEGPEGKEPEIWSAGEKGGRGVPVRQSQPPCEHTQRQRVGCGPSAPGLGPRTNYPFSGRRDAPHPPPAGNLPSVLGPPPSASRQVSFNG